MRKDRGRRLAIRLAACAVVGAVVTVVVAWACYRWAPLGLPNQEGTGKEALAELFAAMNTRAPWLVPVPKAWSPDPITFHGVSFGGDYHEQYADEPAKAGLLVHDSGYPFLALRSWLRGIGQSPDLVYRGLLIGTGDRNVFPIVPLLPGLVFDTAFYAAIAFTLWSAPGMIGGHRRRVRGHCPACGYDLGGMPTATCPECGA